MYKFIIAVFVGMFSDSEHAVQWVVWHSYLINKIYCVLFLFPIATYWGDIQGFLQLIIIKAKLITYLSFDQH